LAGPTDMIMPGRDMRKKFEAFGLHVVECDGHDLSALADAIDVAKAATGTVSVIIADTVKGKGVSFMEGKNTWHGKAIGVQDHARAMLELGGEDG
ncbi:MAG: transketolase, partial [Planctomycetes bacterium]|nr:transketolase [Planctomycetota bacterium]